MPVTRVAIYGGSFDPVHNAHLAVARAAAAQFHLDRVLFVPSFSPPHKGQATHAPYEDRVRMVALACEELNASGGATGFEVSRVEEAAAPSYSIDTIAKIRAQLEPRDELFFIIGADAFAELRTWHRWRDVVDAVKFLVVERPGYSYDVPGGVKVDGIVQLNEPASSSELRRRLSVADLQAAAGKDGADRSIDAPARVIEYIRRHNLYHVSKESH